MKNRCLAWINASLLAAIALLAAPGFTAPTLAASPGDDEATVEDVLLMQDGRELHGHIIEEKGDAVVFELIDRASGIRTKITFLLEEIAEISRDVAIASAEAPTRERPTATSGSTSRPASEPGSSYGARLAEVTDENAPLFYVIPMKGQMGTDVSIEVYREMVDDIEATQPDYIIFEMECRDVEDRIVNRIERFDAGLVDIGILENYKEVVDLFRGELRDIPQVMWIKDAVGAGAMVALAWPEIYMTSEARLGGLAHAAQFFDVADENVKAKFREAYMALLNGFSAHGERDFSLMHAMVRPEFKLSATWKGREVEWKLDEPGEYLVDTSEERTVSFRSRQAENFCISTGTAESLDDLALLMGIREYRLADGEGEEIFEDHREDWRRALESCNTWFGDYQQYMGWASGEDTLKYLGRAKNTLEKILAAMERYRAVEMRVAMEVGARKFDLETLIEQLKERIRALRQSERNRGGGGRRPPGGSPGSSGR